MKKILTTMTALCVIASASFASLQNTVSMTMVRNDADYLQDPLFIFKLQKTTLDLNLSSGMLSAGLGLTGPMRLGFYLSDREAMSTLGGGLSTAILTNYAGIGTNANLTTTSAGRWTDTSMRSLNAVIGLDAMKMGILANFTMNQNANGGSLDMTGTAVNSTVLDMPTIPNGAVSNRLSTNYAGGINNNSSYILTLTPAMMLGDLMVYLPVTGSLYNAVTKRVLVASNEFLLGSPVSNYISNQTSLNDLSTYRIGVAPTARMISTSGTTEFELSGRVSAEVQFYGSTTTSLDYRAATTNNGVSNIIHVVSNVGYRGGYLALPISVNVYPFMLARVTDKVKVGFGASITGGLTLTSYETAATNFSIFTAGAMTSTVSTPNNNRQAVSISAWSASAAVPLYTEVALAEFLTLRVGGAAYYAYTSTSTTTVDKQDFYQYVTTSTNTGGGSTATNNNANHGETTTTTGTYSSSFTTVFSAGLSFTPVKDLQIDLTLSVPNPGSDIMNTANWGIEAIYRF